MRLHKLTPAGIRLFEEQLAMIRAGDPGETIGLILEKEELLEGEVSGLEVASHVFENRFELGQYLHHLCERGSLGDIAGDVGLWSWLTIVFFDQVAPKDSNGRRKIRDTARYVPEVSNFRKRYRHLLSGPYQVFRAHRDAPERTMALLCGELHRPGEVFEQVANRQEVIQNPRAVELVNHLYYDPDSRTNKRGAAGSGPGSVRRLVSYLDQLDVAWDLAEVPLNELVSRLPTEFSRFLT